VLLEKCDDRGAGLRHGGGTGCRERRTGREPQDPNLRFLRPADRLGPLRAEIDEKDLQPLPEPLRIE